MPPQYKPAIFSWHMDSATVTTSKDTKHHLSTLMLCVLGGGPIRYVSLRCWDADGRLVNQRVGWTCGSTRLDVYLADRAADGAGDELNLGVLVALWAWLSARSTWTARMMNTTIFLVSLNVLLPVIWEPEATNIQFYTPYNKECGVARAIGGGT